MQANLLTNTLLPLALAFIMFGMGLSLTFGDFKRIIIYPKAITLGLICQIILLPLIGFGLINLFGLTGGLAVGIMILAACPGGATSNLIAHLSNADTALSISLTAISSLLTIITIPLIVNFSLAYFGEGTTTLKLPVLKTIVQVFVITLIPVFLGMWVKIKHYKFALKSEPFFKIFSAIFLFLIIAAAIAKEKDNVIDFFKLAGPVAISLNISTIFLGFFIGKFFLLKAKQSVTLAIESGIQNGTLGIFVAATLLKNSEMTIPPAIYSLIMFITAFVIIFVGNKLLKT